MRRSGLKLDVLASENGSSTNVTESTATAQFDPASVSSLGAGAGGAALGWKDGLDSLAAFVVSRVCPVPSAFMT